METEKRVLIVTYYWPPSAGSGVQRWLKFVKFLPQTGWKPFVLTPANPSFAMTDPTLEKNIPAEAVVIKIPIWEPYNAFRKVSGVAGNTPGAANDLITKKNKSLFGRVATWIRGNLIIPDPRRFWIRPAVSFLAKYMSENKIPVLVTTGPPHSIHLIGYRLKKKYPEVRWVADFRDPWSEWGFLDSLSVGKTARSIHKRLERNVLETADAVTTITPFYVRHFARLGNRRVHLFTNGYDDEDFRDFKVTRPDKFTIRHIGVVNEKCDPRPFMIALKELLSSDNTVKDQLMLEFVGEVNADFKKYVAGNPDLSDITRFVPSVPHQMLKEIYGRSSMLILILVGYRDAEGYMPGKLFEYIATGLPVLGVGPVNGDAADLINQSQCGIMVEGTDTQAITKFIRENFNHWKTGQLPPLKSKTIDSYSRRGVTMQLAEFFDNLM